MTNTILNEYILIVVPAGQVALARFDDSLLSPIEC